MTPSPVLLVERVSKSFQDLHAVQEVGFTVRPGEVFGFLGPNGAGKTTTLRMIMGITRPDEGRVRFEDGELNRRRVGYLPEERGLFEDMPVAENLIYLGTLRGLARGEARESAAHWLRRLGLEDRARDKLGALSKGNQQKVQFAGAILHEPALAVLDEPFSGLDPLNQERFLELIGDLRERGTAVLLSAHQLDLVERLCDRFLLISRGRELLHGNLEEMRREVAAGAGEVLRLVVRSGDRSPAEELGAVVAELPGTRELRVRNAGDGRSLVEVALPEDTDLSPVLTRIGSRYPVVRVTMETLSLHEIYVRAVRADGREPEPELAEPVHA